MHISACFPIARCVGEGCNFNQICTLTLHFLLFCVLKLILDVSLETPLFFLATPETKENIYMRKSVIRTGEVISSRLAHNGWAVTEPAPRQELYSSAAWLQEGYPCWNFKGCKRAKCGTAFVQVTHLACRREAVVAAGEINFVETSVNSIVRSLYLMPQDIREFTKLFTSIQQSRRQRQLWMAVWDTDWQPTRSCYFTAQGSGGVGHWNSTISRLF